MRRSVQKLDRFGSHRRKADWIEQFYTLCYGMPQMQAITWWSFNDPGYIPNSGLLMHDLKPKESYHRLLKLITDWRTEEGRL